jgi:hypothetical protein
MAGWGASADPSPSAARRRGRSAPASPGSRSRAGRSAATGRWPRPASGPARPGRRRTPAASRRRRRARRSPARAAPRRRSTCPHPARRSRTAREGPGDLRRSSSRESTARAATRLPAGQRAPDVERTPIRRSAIDPHSRVGSRGREVEVRAGGRPLGYPRRAGPGHSGPLTAPGARRWDVDPAAGQQPPGSHCGLCAVRRSDAGPVVELGEGLARVERAGRSCAAGGSRRPGALRPRGTAEGGGATGATGTPAPSAAPMARRRPAHALPLVRTC